MNPHILALIHLIGAARAQAVAQFLDALADAGDFSVRPSTLAKEIREAVAAENVGWGGGG